MTMGGKLICGIASRLRLLGFILAASCCYSFLVPAPSPTCGSSCTSSPPSSSSSTFSASLPSSASLSAPSSSQSLSRVSSSRLGLRESDDSDFDAEFNKRIDQKLSDRFPTASEGNGRRSTERRVGGDKRSRGSPQRAFFSGLKNREGLTRAVAAGLFIGGIGAGIAIDSAINTNPKVFTIFSFHNPAKFVSMDPSTQLIIYLPIFLPFHLSKCPPSIYLLQSCPKSLHIHLCPPRT